MGLRRDYKPWTLGEEELIRSLRANKVSMADIAARLGRTHESTYRKAKKLGLMATIKLDSESSWTEAEDALIRVLFLSEKEDWEIVEALESRSLNEVARRRGHLNLYRMDYNKRVSRRLKARPMPVVGPASTCQWIDGDPPCNGSQPAFCGEPSSTGRSWCPEHCARVYRTEDWKPVPVSHFIERRTER